MYCQLYESYIFNKQDPFSPTSIQTYNRRLKSMKIKVYYNIDEINKNLDEIEVKSTRNILCNALTHYYRIELENIYQSAQTPAGNYVYTNEQEQMIKIIKLIKDMLTERIIALCDKYEEERNKNELSKEELESFMTWDDVIKMRDNLSDTEIYEKLILYLYTYFSPRRVKDYHQLYYSNRTSEEMMEEDKENNFITSDSMFIFNKYKNAKSYKQKVFDCLTEIYLLINRMGYKDGDRLFPTKN